MKIDKIISKISSIIATIIVLIFASGMYLSSKGFVKTPNGSFALINDAQAKNSSKKTLPNNVAIPKGQIMGNKNAPITVYEFSSFKCHHCSRFHTLTLPKIKKEFIDTGKINFVFIDFPLDAASMQASIISKCVPQEKYQGFINALFANQKKLGTDQKDKEFLKTLAKEHGLSEQKFDACLKNTKIAQQILDNRQDSISNLKIMGTPSFIVKTPKEVISYEGTISKNDILEILNKN